jgi:hypothetical protein
MRLATDRVAPESPIQPGLRGIHYRLEGYQLEVPNVRSRTLIDNLSRI